MGIYYIRARTNLRAFTVFADCGGPFPLLPASIGAVWQLYIRQGVCVCGGGGGGGVGGTFTDVCAPVCQCNEVLPCIA